VGEREEQLERKKGQKQKESAPERKVRAKRKFGLRATVKVRKSEWRNRFHQEGRGGEDGWQC